MHNEEGPCKEVPATLHVPSVEDGLRAFSWKHSHCSSAQEAQAMGRTDTYCGGKCLNGPHVCAWRVVAHAA